VDWWIRDGSGGIQKINIEKSSLGNVHDASIQKYTSPVHIAKMTLHFKMDEGRQLKSPVDYYSPHNPLPSI
jgi:hypothetical protein